MANAVDLSGEPALPGGVLVGEERLPWGAAAVWGLASTRTTDSGLATRLALDAGCPFVFWSCEEAGGDGDLDFRGLRPLMFVSA